LPTTKPPFLGAEIKKWFEGYCYLACTIYSLLVGHATAWTSLLSNPADLGTAELSEVGSANMDKEL
jgi:hypothetical protein